MFPRRGGLVRSISLLTPRPSDIKPPGDILEQGERKRERETETETETRTETETETETERERFIRLKIE